MPRRRHREEPENHERWLVSYADFITLLFAFFVVMYAVSSVNEGKLRVLSDSLVGTFQSRNKSLNPIQIGKLVRSPFSDDQSAITRARLPPPAIAALSPRPDVPADEASVDGAGNDAGEIDAGGEDGPGAGQDDGSMANVDNLADQVEENLSGQIDDELFNVRRRDKWVEIEFKSSMLFQSGDARLSPQAVRVLDKLSTLLVEFPNPIQVEGFTDDVPIQTLAFPSNWELSAARAASVVHLFAKLGVNPERLAAVGYGEHRPIADNSTAEGRSENRRVVLVIPAKQGDQHLLQLNRMAGESSAGGVNTVQPWAEAPGDSN